MAGGASNYLDREVGGRGGGNRELIVSLELLDYVGRP
jgi:hypothetical protein